MPSFAPFSQAGIRGFLHEAAHAGAAGLVLTHGAGSNCEAPLLVAAAEAFRAAGISVLRCDLPYRQQRRTGPPFSGGAAADREGLRQAAAAMRARGHRTVFLAGHSYGGRQASMLAADDAGVAEALLLFSYPLHPPKKPAQLRTEHFPRLKTRALFVHGTRDAFGTIAELDGAVALIPAWARILRIEGAGHDLRGGRFDLAPVVEAFLSARAG